MKELKIISSIVIVPFLMCFNILLFSKAVIFYYCFSHNITNINAQIYSKIQYIGSFIGDIVTILLLLMFFILLKNKINKFLESFKLKISKRNLLEMLSLTLILYLITFTIQILFSHSTNEFDYYINFSIIEIIIVIFIIPYLEEIIFRFFIFESLNKHLNTYLAIFVQALLFGFVHVAFNKQALFQGIYTFIFGIILGIAYNKNKNLNESYICHVFFNLMSLIVIPFFALLI